MNRKEIGERLRIAREECMYSRQKAANYADVGTTTLQQWETGSREASIETIGKLAREYGVSPQYIIFGDSDSGVSSTPRTDYAIDKPDDDYVYVPAYDVEVSAGAGAVCLGESEASKYLAFRKHWLTARGLNVKSLAAMFTKGDSMTPTIPESAVVVINRDQTKPLDGKVYVIRIEDRHYVKRIQWLIGGGLRLISDNKFYDPLDITKADMEATNIEICGQVIHASYDLPD
ncbi:XRE family transcriptional regulator [Psychrobacter sp. T6-1]|uniref:XRE family transcriptional regulator n=1 Tax=Psychrobacter sp. T6-1 TaxID=3457447 RepID=UPI003FD3250B